MTLTEAIMTNVPLDVCFDEGSIYDPQAKILTRFEVISDLDRAIERSLLKAWRDGHVRALDNLHDGIQRAFRDAHR